MYKQVKKTKETKNNNVGNSVVQKKYEQDNKMGIVDNRALSLQAVRKTVGNNREGVTQRVNYKNVEYSHDRRAVKKFIAVAETDLNNLGHERVKERDLKMLKVIGNSERTLTDPADLHEVIHPRGQNYHNTVDANIKYLSPFSDNIRERVRNTIGNSGMYRMAEGDSARARVKNDMHEIINDSMIINEKIQWTAIDGMRNCANTIINKSQDEPYNTLTELGSKEERTKREEKVWSKLTKVVDKGEILIRANANKIEETTNDIGPALRASADEQYLRGTVGASNGEGEGRHINIGKKTATKALQDANVEEGNGILWAKVWSLGVNEAFIEGGTDSNYEFRLITPYPSELRDSLIGGDTKLFTDKVIDEGAKVGNAESAWRAFYHQGKGELTTLSKELAQLLDNGYKLKVEK